MAKAKLLEIQSHVVYGGARRLQHPTAAQTYTKGVYANPYITESKS